MTVQHNRLYRLQNSCLYIWKVFFHGPLLIAVTDSFVPYSGEEIEITFSYWDGSGHRKTVKVITASKQQQK